MNERRPNNFDLYIYKMLYKKNLVENGKKEEELIKSQQRKTTNKIIFECKFSFR